MRSEEWGRRGAVPTRAPEYRCLTTTRQREHQTHEEVHKRRRYRIDERQNSHASLPLVRHGIDRNPPARRVLVAAIPSPVNDRRRSFVGGGLAIFQRRCGLRCFAASADYVLDGRVLQAAMSRKHKRFRLGSRKRFHRGRKRPTEGITPAPAEGHHHRPNPGTPACAVARSADGRGQSSGSCPPVPQFHGW